MKVSFAALVCLASALLFPGLARAEAQCCTSGSQPAAALQGGLKDGVAGNNGAKDISEEFRLMLKRDKEARAHSCEGQPGYKLANGNRQDGGTSPDKLSMRGANAGQDGALTAEIIEQARARARAEKEIQLAVAKPGTRVCRKFTVGIAEIDWIRGVVVEADSSHLCIKIDDPGLFAHTLNGSEIIRGSMVWDAVLVWTPCVE